MKFYRSYLAIAVIFIFTVLAFAAHAQQQNEEPWKESQLMAPAELAQLINDPSAVKPVIFSIGPGAYIKGSIDIGPAREKTNLEKLKQQLSKLPKNRQIVIYCGCCPFVHCPNIRPAFALLNEMHFTRQRLLNLASNLKVDWLDKGYPQNQ
jgi:hypothetical protein